MNPPRRCIATKALFVLLSLLAAAAAQAGVAGTVANLSGPLLAKKGDGSVKILSLKSNVDEGDTLISEKDTYARIRFIDNSEITLRPNSQLKIDNFSFEEDKQDNDKASFSLVKGGLRAVTGVLGKRSKERFGMNTPTATIGIRGTIFIAEYVPPEDGADAVAAYGRASVAANAYGASASDVSWNGAPLEVLPMRLAQNAPGLPGPGARPPGLYVQVIDGLIHLANPAGTQNFAAGQFGYTASIKQPPIILPSNPGIQFLPPPSFNSSSSGPGGKSNSASGNVVDCEVR